MPELPEVETISRVLREGGPVSPPLLGRVIVGSDLSWQRTLAYPLPEEFADRIMGQVVEDIGRRGKFLMLRLDTDTLLFHLRMSGDLVLESANEPPDVHNRLILDLDNGNRLAFNDTRKFGRVWLVSDPQEILGSLGPEPLGTDFTEEVLFGGLIVRRRQIKPLLMDQSFLAGMGNIYVDEALHRAKIHPLTISNQIDREQSDQLWRSVRRVLEDGINRNGTSFDWVYRGGDFQNYLRVYQRTGEACPECGTLIERIVVGQRGTHICPTCQIAPV
ncbi:MAG: bifunctional DNA-formamidopyrimidine glycosylase/DNA-(apurinic or apyrimidinic site) lyase [Anaerolineales bacterium]